MPTEAEIAASGLTRMPPRQNNERLAVVTVRMSIADWSELKEQAYANRVTLNCLCVHRLMLRPIDNGFSQ